MNDSLSPVDGVAQQVAVHCCPLCLGTSFGSFRSGLSKCQSCEFVVNPEVWSAGSDARLEEEFFDSDSFRPDGTAWTRLFDRWNARRTLRRLEGMGMTSGRVLEVGVGSGIGLAFLRSHGYEVEGCDLSASVCRAVEARHGIRMHAVSLDAMIGRERFDVLVMNHVVEHVSDPLTFLRDARALLGAGGVLHIAVPNVESWNAALPGWTSYQPYHLTYFSPRTLRRAVETAGLSTRILTTHEPFSGWFLAIARTLVGVGGTAAGTTSGAGRGPAAEAFLRMAMLLVGVISYPLRRVQAAMGAGEEIVVVASAAPDR